MTVSDDLILNISEAPSKVKRNVGATIKGGRWTDRVKARRITKRKNGQPQGSFGPVSESRIASAELDESPRPTKKVRKTKELDIPKASKQDQPFKAASNNNRQIISSLFSYNPKIVVADETDDHHHVVKPSNAPLTDRSTFTGLGLDPLIYSHLETKMHISRPTAIQQASLPPLLSTSDEDTSERDIFIQSQTGSGKTLSYLLPIVQDLLPLSSLSYIDRSIGTLAIIIAPTRELAKQISDVLEALLNLRLRPREENADEAGSQRLTRWLVSGLLIGGENRTHEKSRLRKGLPILVSTPGRLLDHLQNTSSFNVGKCRWLVLDEADRLMDLGFEESIKGILQALDGRRKLAIQAVEEGKSTEVGGWDWKRRRRTVLCSATIKETVQHLAGTALVKPIVVKAIEEAKEMDKVDSTTNNHISQSEKFTPPSQLSQRYVVVPLKLRLVALVSLLRSLLSRSHSRNGSKIIVFLSCTDSVDYHWQLLGNSSIDELSEDSEEQEESNDSADESSTRQNANTDEKISLSSALLPDTQLYRLHGSLPLQTRLRSLKAFSTVEKRKSGDVAQSSASAVLLCTSVAARGLDLPLVRAVIQYDLPTEGGATEYVHRVGRTARAGKGGEAWSFVSPSEESWVKWTEERIQNRDQENTGNNDETEKRRANLVAASVESVLRSGFGGKGSEYEARATQVQLAFERWVLKSTENGKLAQRAFQSHMRAYATHPADEKHMFHVRHLHIGHLAKAFALREAPSNIGQKGGPRNNAASFKSRTKSNSRVNETSRKSDGRNVGNKRKQANDSDSDHENPNSAEKRMQEVVRRQGRLVKKAGVLVASGTDDFQIAGGYDLEKLISQSG